MQRDYLPSINNTVLMVSMGVPRHQADQVVQITSNDISKVSKIDLANQVKSEL